MLKIKLGGKLPNNTTLVAITEVNAGEAVVLALTDGQSGHPYAVWWMRLSDNACSSGEYCFTLRAAFDAYTSRGGK